MDDNFSSFMQAELSPDALGRLQQAEQAEKDARLMPVGTYEGVIQPEWEVQTVERQDSPYYGEPNVRVTAELYNVGDMMATRKFSFNLSSVEKLKQNGRPEAAFKLFGQLAKATGTKNLKDALDAASATRLRYRIAKFTGKGEGEEARNFLAAITTVA